MDNLNILFKKLTNDEENIEMELLNKENIKIVKDYDSSISSRLLLSSLLFYHNKDKLANLRNNKELSDDIISSSKNLINKIINSENFNNEFDKYKEIYEKWRDEDLKQNQKIKEDVEKKVKIIMKKAFWDKVYQDLVDKKNEGIMVLLEDLKEKIKSLVLKEETKNSIDNQFDVVIIKQIIDHDKMENEEFEMFFGKLAMTVKNLQSPNNDQPLEDAIEIIKTQLGEDWKLAFVSSLKVLTEAVSQIYIDLLNI